MVFCSSLLAVREFAIQLQFLGMLAATTSVICSTSGLFSCVEIFEVEPCQASSTADCCFTGLYPGIGAADFSVVPDVRGFSSDHYFSSGGGHNPRLPSSGGGHHGNTEVFVVIGPQLVPGNSSFSWSCVVFLALQQFLVVQKGCHVLYSVSPEPSGWNEVPQVPASHLRDQAIRSQMHF